LLKKQAGWRKNKGSKSQQMGLPRYCSPQHAQKGNGCAYGRHFFSGVVCANAKKPQKRNA